MDVKFPATDFTYNKDSNNAEITQAYPLAVLSSDINLVYIYTVPLACIIQFH